MAAKFGERRSAETGIVLSAAVVVLGDRIRREKGRNGLLPNSIKAISSCLKTVSSSAGSVASTVRSARVTVAGSISLTAEEDKDQILWVAFDKIQFSHTCFRRALLLGYVNGFQVLDVEDSSNIHELVSKHTGPVTYIQVLPVPALSEGTEEIKASHPLVLVVAGEETNVHQQVDYVSIPTLVRFFSLRSHSYAHVLSPRVVAVALSSQIYCFDALTLENKFSVLTYPIQGLVGTNIGLGPLAVGTRWLAYASNNPISSNSGRLSPQNLASSPGVSPSTSPSSGNLVARYAVESSMQLAAGIINLGDMGYKTLSKYCQDLLPDGSNSPTSSGFGWKAGRFGSAAQMNEEDNAGVVLIKDFVTREVISHFRAHSSPISALCFDPSGTILVTASVNGNNLNVFRITPNRHSYDWATSHVHIYKLYRGMTAAVIQDICFSHYSQWVAVVSSHGTCHIYLMSPFGGNVVLQAQSSHTNEPSLVPSLSRPWWTTWTSTKDQTFLPPPVLQSVISRIKDGNSGWLSTVSSIATSATGKVPTPSGALAAVFQGSINSNPKALERLLVCSPSGHLVQYELLPSSMAESHYSSLKLGADPILQTQDEELRVNAAPIQWWDVRRRSNDRYDDGHDRVDISADAAAKDFGRNHEKSQWYFSNAEVHVSSGRVPMWQRSKVRFYSMNSPRAESFTSHGDGGEIEIESISASEVETKRKDLLPVFGRQREHIGITDLTGLVQVGEKPISNGITEHPEGPLHEGQISGGSERTREIPSLMKEGSPSEAPSGTRVSCADGSTIMIDHSWINGQNMIADDDDGAINIGSGGVSRDFSSYAREEYCDELGVEGSSVEVVPDADNDDPLMGAVFPFEGEDLNDRRAGFTD